MDFLHPPPVSSFLKDNTDFLLQFSDFGGERSIVPLLPAPFLFYSSSFSSIFENFSESFALKLHEIVPLLIDNL